MKYILTSEQKDFLLFLQIITRTGEFQLKYFDTVKTVMSRGMYDDWDRDLLNAIVKDYKEYSQK